jgi:hypothetical protein
MQAEKMGSQAAHFVSQYAIRGGISKGISHIILDFFIPVQPHKISGGP